MPLYNRGNLTLFMVHYLFNGFCVYSRYGKNK